MTLVVVTGVGTDVGKTHVTASLVRAWGQVEPVAAYKPIESGVVGAQGLDELLLSTHATFHVQRPLLQHRLRLPVSPHLAARLEGQNLELAPVVAEARGLGTQAPLVVELAGGLFSPLSDTTVNADLVSALQPDVLLVVAPNRLGVLHDIRALVEAARGRGLRPDGVVLNAPPQPDASTDTNAHELVRTFQLPVLAEVPRGTIEELAELESVRGLVAYCRRERSQAPSLE